MRPETVFANRRKVTHIIPVEDAYVWIRTFSTNAGFRAATPAAQVMSLLERGSVSFDAGTPFRNGFAYETAVNSPVVKYVNKPNDWPLAGIEVMVDRLADGLASFHDAARVAGMTGLTSSMDTARFLAGQADYLCEHRAASICTALTRHLSDIALDELAAWYKGAPGLVGHGEYSLANVLSASGRPDEFTVLTDPYLPLVPEGFDVGWFLGDLFETSMSPVGAFGARAAASLGRRFVARYEQSRGGAVLDHDELWRSFVLRLLHHYIEFRAGRPGASDEAYYLDAIRREYARESGTFSSAVFACISA